MDATVREDLAKRLVALESELTTWSANGYTYTYRQGLGGMPPRRTSQVELKGVSDSNTIWPAQKDQNGWNDWVKNDKIKTAKCSICDRRVQKYSWTCRNCRSRVCSECSEDAGDSTPRNKFVAQDKLTKKCHCAYKNRGGFPPGLQSQIVKNLADLAAAELKEATKNDVDTQDHDAIALSSAGQGAATASIEDIALQQGRRKQMSDGDTDATSTSATAATIAPTTGAGIAPTTTASSAPTTAASIVPMKPAGIAPRTAATRPKRHQLKPVNYRELTNTRKGTAKPVQPLKGLLKAKVVKAPARPPVALNLKRSAKTERIPEPAEPAGPLSAPLLALPTAATPAPPQHKLAHTTTVIVGAGLIGLFTAHTLARKCASTKTPHRILVVENQEIYCSPGTASGNCAGILSAFGTEIDPTTNWLVVKATEAWRELLRCIREDVEEEGEINEAVSYVDRGVFSVNSAEGEGQGWRPEWYKGGGWESFTGEKDHMGKIDTRELAKWIRWQCHDLGVEFRFGCEVRGVEMDAEGRMRSVRVEEVQDMSKGWSGMEGKNGGTGGILTDRSDGFATTNPAVTTQHAHPHSSSQGRLAETYSCDQLVLTAGPWTSGIFRRLFPNSLYYVDNYVQDVHWVRAKLDPLDLAGRNDVALVLPHAAVSEQGLDNQVTIAALPGREAVLVTAVGKEVAHVHLRPIVPYYGPPDVPADRQLVQLAGHLLDPSLRVEGFVHGCAHVSTAGNGLPNGDRLRPRDFRRLPAANGSEEATQLLKLATEEELRKRKDAEDSSPNGVYLCYGFGMRGTSLGPGAAAAVVATMFGEEL
ncbi:hypothetical protein LTR62_003536 [Meristemomyces frigidus]|uniref:FAD dependent oxidoreductase domain-containing protein n=1 Tax=Meristemomyces frigidus TaxID=1508187 RepID=A0AAN7THN2_9PEZI|nr:hypothetical protein LTR62_003536 [Meristemomyces frigidus]